MEEWIELLLPIENNIKLPDLKIYELLLERYHLKADECLFIDDSLDNINACKNVGMNGIHLPDHSKLEEKLKEHHII